MSTLTVKLKLILSKTERDLLLSQMNACIDTVNALTERTGAGEDISNLTTKDFFAPLPSAAKNQCIRDAKSVVRTYSKRCKKADAAGKEKPFMPCLKKKVFYDVTG